MLKRGIKGPKKFSGRPKANDDFVDFNQSPSAVQSGETDKQ